jgi:Tol biopolymer transport system component
MRRIYRHAAQTGIAAVAGITAVGFASSAEGSFPGRNGRIAITYEFKLSGTQLGTMAADGKSLRMLTGECGARNRDSSDPEWSPDGRWLLFQNRSPSRNPRGYSRISADGSGLTTLPLTGGALEDFLGRPSFAPDGKRFLYVRISGVNDGANPSYLSIWLARLDGSQDRRLRAGSAPRWSPDGRTIAFVGALPGVAAGDGDDGVWLLDARSNQPLRRIAPSANLYWPDAAFDWSPDSRRLVYITRAGVFVVRANGRGRHKLTSALKDPTQALWSPNGHRIAVVSEHELPNGDRRHVISTMSSTGTRLKRIFAGKRFDSDAGTPPPQISWQPRPSAHNRARSRSREPGLVTAKRAVPQRRPCFSAM